MTRDLPMESDVEFWWKQVAGGLRAPPAPRPWRAASGRAGDWDVLDANLHVIASMPSRALAELVAHIPDLMERP